MDALSNTHPVEVEVHNPNQIGEIFDVISYDKGASVIRMLAEYLGEKDFRDGLRYYLKKHSYKNASTIHLWEAFEKISKKPVKKIMSVWTGKSGYPLLSVLVVGNKLVLSQKRYFSNITSAKKSKDTTLWPIPLAIVSPDGEKKLSLMSKKQISMPLSTDAWFKYNAHEGSVYRTKYSKNILKSLEQPIVEKTLSVEDRLGLIRDMFSFAEAGESDTVSALEMTRLYKGETEYVVWVEITAGLLNIANLLYGTKSFESFRLYARDVLSEIVKTVGWVVQPNEFGNTALLRSLVLGAASYFGNADVIAEAHKIFTDIQITAIPPDLRGVVYSTVVREGDEKAYETLCSMYLVENLHEEKERILVSLGKSRNKKLLERSLNFALGDEVRLQDKNRALAGVLSNPYGKELGWKFIKKNWKKIETVYGDGGHLFGRLMSVLSVHTDVEIYKDIKDFFKMHQFPSAERTIQQTLENIDSKITWKARDEQKISQWLKNNK